MRLLLLCLAVKEPSLSRTADGARSGAVHVYKDLSDPDSVGTTRRQSTLGKPTPWWWRRPCPRRGSTSRVCRSGREGPAEVLDRMRQPDLLRSRRVVLRDALSHIAAGRCAVQWVGLGRSAMRTWIGAASIAAVTALAWVAAAAAGPTVGANHLVDLDHGLAFPQNKQNEPAVTRDPLTGVLVAGANDEIGQPLCPGTTAPLASPCPFEPGVPTSGFYRSTDNGATWTGGYLPGFDAIGRTSGGDPTLDYGPRRCANSHFSFSCGVAIYYGSLADPFGDKVGGEQVTVSRSYDDGLTWSNPVEATSTDNKSAFDDHEWIAADHSPESPYFGRLYVFWAVFCYSCAGNGNVKLYVAHSDDEGRSWARAVQVSAGNNNSAQGFRETGQVAVASDGTVEAFWTENADSKGKYPDTQVVVTSKDGGSTFTAPITIGTLTDYPLSGTPFDVVDLFNRVPGMSARVDCYPHPAADPSSARVYVVWCDFSDGQGTVQGAVSSDGVHWTPLGTVASLPGRNAFFPEAAVSPSGT